MLVILVSAALAHVILFYRGPRRADPPRRNTVYQSRLRRYLSAVIGGDGRVLFCRAREHKAIAKTCRSTNTVFAVFVTAVWSMTPLALLIIVPEVERVEVLLRTLEPFGQTAALAAVSFFFGKAG